jgi:hypothetical protein
MENAYYLKNDSCLVTFDKKLQFLREEGGGWGWEEGLQNQGTKLREYIGYIFVQLRPFIVITFNAIIQLMLSVCQRTSHLSQICTCS